MSALPHRRPMALRGAGLAAWLAGSLAACTPTHIGPPPTISLAGRTCSALPELAAAHPLSFDAQSEVAVTLDGSGPCLQDGQGAKSLYAVFRLPAASTPYQITIASQPLGAGLFSPHLLLVDDQGKVLREIPRDSFLFHGDDLSVALRAHPGEAYLVAASDPQSVGQQVSQIAENTSTTVMPAGPYAMVFISRGSDATSTYTYAHNGTIKVSVKSL